MFSYIVTWVQKVSNSLYILMGVTDFLRSVDDMGCIMTSPTFCYRINKSAYICTQVQKLQFAQ